MKKVFIIDHRYTGQLVLLFQALYKDKAEIHCNFAKLRHGMKIDLFFIDKGSISQMYLEKFKKEHGKKNAKVVAMCPDSIFLKHLKVFPGVDYAHNCFSMIESAELEFEKLTNYQKKLLNSYLRNSKL